jgi:type I restriction enzyme S subunit
MSSDWPAVPLGEVLTQVRDVVTIADSTVYKQVTVRLWGKGAVIRQEALGKEIKTKRQFRLRAGQLVYSRIDARLGAVALTPPDLDSAIVSTDFPVFDLVIDRIEPQFLNYFAQTRLFLDQCDRESLGTSKRTRIKEAEFLKIAIPLPPLDEQRWIVARLDALRVRVEQALALQGAAIAEAEALIDASLYSIFCDAATADWQATMLEALTEIRAGVTLGRKLTGATIGVPYLRVANVQDGRLDLAEVKEVAIRPDELAKWRLQFGDLVLTEGGDFDKLGRGTIWRNEIVDCIHQNHIFRVRPNQEVILPEFLELEIRSPYGKGYFLSKAKKTTNLASINQAQLREFPVRFPAKARQATIVAEIGELHQRIETLIQAQRESEQELQAMLPAALDRAFRGEL